MHSRILPSWNCLHRKKAVGEKTCGLQLRLRQQIIYEALIISFPLFDSNPIYFLIWIFFLISFQALLEKTDAGSFGSSEKEER